MLPPPRFSSSKPWRNSVSSAFKQARESSKQPLERPYPLPRIVRRKRVRLRTAIDEVRRKLRTSGREEPAGQTFQKIRGPSRVIQRRRWRWLPIRSAVLPSRGSTAPGAEDGILGVLRVFDSEQSIYRAEGTSELRDRRRHVELWIGDLTHHVDTSPRRPPTGLFGTVTCAFPCQQTVPESITSPQSGATRARTWRSTRTRSASGS